MIFLVYANWLDDVLDMLIMVFGGLTIVFCGLIVHAKWPSDSIWCVRLSIGVIKSVMDWCYTMNIISNGSKCKIYLTSYYSLMKSVYGSKFILYAQCLMHTVQIIRQILWLRNTKACNFALERMGYIRLRMDGWI